MEVYVAKYRKHVLCEWHDSDGNYIPIGKLTEEEKEARREYYRIYRAKHSEMINHRARMAYRRRKKQMAENITPEEHEQLFFETICALQDEYSAMPDSMKDAFVSRLEFILRRAQRKISVYYAKQIDDAKAKAKQQRQEKSDNGSGIRYA